MSKNLKNLLTSICALLIILGIAFRYCNNKNGNNVNINAIIEDHKKSDSAYADSLNFVRGLLELRENQIEARDLIIDSLENKIDLLINKHEVTKKKIKPLDFYNSDTGFVLAPNEYVTECEDCFNVLGEYKKQNVQLRFERDGYDSLMRQQSSLQESQILTLQSQRNGLTSKLIKSEARRINDSINALPSRKLKLSAMGMANDLFIPNGGGPGLIYEDKKSNEFGGHVIFTTRGKIYLFHIAKKISFKRKR